MDKELQNLADEEILKYANVEVEKRLKREIVYLYRLLRFLRKNCPWDRVQNHESLEKQSERGIRRRFVTTRLSQHISGRDR